MSSHVLTSSWLRRRAAASLSCVLIAGAAADANAQASEASALSLLPVAVVSSAPTAIFSAGASLVVVGVEVSAAGTVWVLERAADGVRATRLKADRAGASCTS